MPDYVWEKKGRASGPRAGFWRRFWALVVDGIVTAVIVYGGDNKKTPSGELHILAKARNHRSSLYDASMPYTLRLTGDGVSIHGSSVRWGAATHGCIGVPLPFAERLFEAVRIGDEVDISPPGRTGA